MKTYEPSEFTLSEYTRLLLIAKDRFVFKKYTEGEQAEKCVFWRHDIDLSLIHALKLAEIEHAQGISATYFIHLHNVFYNALDIHAKQLIQKILSLGHTLGLHFDIAYYNVQTLEALTHWLEFEKTILESVFQTKVDVFSFHNTNEVSMGFEDASYAGMVNTYSQLFKSEVAYCSDSNGHWRHQKLADVLIDDSIHKLQVLTHPGWWSEQEITPREKVVEHIKMRSHLTMSNYDKTLVEFERLNF